MNFGIIFSSLLILVISILSVTTIKNHDSLNFREWLFSPVEADLLVSNGTIYTSDASLPFADSMAVHNGRILRIGNYASVQKHVGYNTQKLNLQGKVIVPGFIDSHVHLLFGGIQIARVELRSVKSKEEFIKKVKEALPKINEGSWILGGGWNNDFWGGELPSASWIDEVTLTNPVWLSRMDGHMGLANSLALKFAKITKTTPDPNGGAIVKNNENEPTGLLIDSAMMLIQPYIPEVSISERREALERASNLALSRGITTVVDFGRYFPGASSELSWEDFFDVYKWADMSEKMRIRVCLFFPMETLHRLKSYITYNGRKLSEWIYLGGVKAFSDGSLGSNSALFNEPYLDEPNNYGLQVTDTETMLNTSFLSDKFGIQVAIHAIGDKANDLIVNMYEKVVLVNGKKDRRFRIEHAQHLSPGTTLRIGRQKIVVSAQPDHLLDDADTAIKKLGFERALNGSYLFNSLLSSNALLAFGSDWPVADMNPLKSIKTAVKRIPPGWDDAWGSSECVQVTDALNSYTISAAEACFLDQDVGSLSVGKMADFVVLSPSSWDEFTSMESVSVMATYVSGVQAFP